MTETAEHDFVRDLRKLIQKKQAVVVVGSGVSISTTQQAPTWRGLIESGVQRCQDLGADASWCDLVRTQTKMESHPDMLLSAAELVHQKLCENGGGEFSRWLRECFEHLQPENSCVIKALAALDAPLVTTNYDDLIEKVTGLKHVTWRDPRNVTRVVRGDDRRVLHLHGYWEEPESVVLGIRSYEAVKNHEHTQAVIKAFGMTKSFLFVGCGDEGLADPNFGNFLSWLEAVETAAGVEHRHYRLVLKKEVTQPQGRVFTLSYGDSYDDLPGFLRELCDKNGEDIGDVLVVEFRLDQEHVSFDQDRFITLIRDITGISLTGIKISVRKGSTIVRLEGNTRTLTHLVKLLKNSGKFDTLSKSINIECVNWFGDECEGSLAFSLSRCLNTITSLPETITYYLDCLAEDTANITLLGMGRSLQVELPIAEAYVPLRTTLARSLETRSTDRFKENHAEYEEDLDLGEVFRKTAALDQRGVVLLGEPGSGKTTGARQLAWCLASRQSLPEDLGLPAGMTPVLLRFRNIKREVLSKKNGLEAFLKDETYCEEAPEQLKSPGPDLWNGKAGGLLWILDGLDEVADPEARQKVSAWVRRALTKRPNDWFLVTCRFQGYYRQGVPLGPKFAEFHVRPLNDSQVEQFVRDWFAAAYKKLLGQGTQAEERAQGDSNELLAILSHPPHQTGHMRELCTNPLLLTILCIVFHEERKLPTGRAELYGHCVRVLLEYWRRDLYAAGRGTELVPYDAEAAQAVLARLAWWMHQEQDRTSAPLEELAKEATKGLAEVSSKSGLGQDGSHFLERMRDEAGILALAGEGTCGFLHLSFQEYLAAQHAVNEGLAQTLAQQSTESWWREVALLSLRSVQRPYCETFFTAMLDAGIAENHPDLASRCLEEARFFVPSPFVTVLKSPGHVPDRRVAAVLRLLRGRYTQVPEIEAMCSRLMETQNLQIREFAHEILMRIVDSTKIRPETATIDARTEIAFVIVPAGSFQMGSNTGYKDEKPVHAVNIPHDFMLGKYPVTNAQYRRFMEAASGKVKKPEYWDNRRFNRPEQPVVGVSWEDAQAFCQWAECRLPSEAEWEYACRAGTTTEYSFGDSEKELGDYAWFDENNNGQTQPVGAKKPNPWGLYDMHGNVKEWCQDLWHENYNGAPDNGSAWCDRGSFRVFRGGSWDFPALICRSAIRIRRKPSYRRYNLGFRVARSFESKQAGIAESDT